MRELRISRYHWEELDEDKQHEIKTLSQEYSSDFGLNWEYNYYWIRFTEEQFFLAKLKFGHLFSRAFGYHG
jgi:hypothetical protein